MTAWQDWNACKARLDRIRPRLQKRYPDSYILVCVVTGRFSIVSRRDKKLDGHTLAHTIFAEKYGRAASYTTFLGWQL